ncbi:MAG: glycogen synthase GlgA [Rhizobiaceae bacterium]
MKVLSVASELYPLIKTGGLADVAGALPLALKPLGVSVTSMLPGYPAVMAALKRTTKKKVLPFRSLMGAKAELLAVRYRGLDLLILDAPQFFDRDGGPYGDTAGGEHDDNWRRFAAFSRAAADVALGAVEGYRPDVVHAHDWQAAMVPAYLRYSGAAAPPSVATVHNLAFQGQFPSTIFPELGLPPAAHSVDGIEYYGGIGFLKAGLQAASAITTVSPTYAQEIRTPEFGMGLDGLINSRADVLHGILNGIDTDEWNPATDPNLLSGYSSRSIGRRAINRGAIEERFGLEADASPLFCVVSRLTWQKGMDILANSIDRIVAMGGRLAVLGSGDKALEGAILAAAARNQGRVGIVTGYDEALSHGLQGGADAILVPSRFEPCGLTQFYGLRYGCVPVVARTGGLADTVIDANAAALNAGVATGFQFSPLARETLLHAVGRAIRLHGNRRTWRRVQRNGMKADVSWQASAARYADLFKSLSGGSPTT